MTNRFNNKTNKRSLSMIYDHILETSTNRSCTRRCMLLEWDVYDNVSGAHCSGVGLSRFVISMIRCHMPPRGPRVPREEPHCSSEGPLNIQAGLSGSRLQQFETRLVLHLLHTFTFIANIWFYPMLGGKWYSILCF